MKVTENREKVARQQEQHKSKAAVIRETAKNLELTDARIANLRLDRELENKLHVNAEAHHGSRSGGNHHNCTSKESL